MIFNKLNIKITVTLLFVFPLIAIAASSALRPMNWASSDSDTANGIWASSASDYSAGFWAFSATDTDSDSLSDEWEQRYFGDLDETGSGTSGDSDSLTNAQEAQYLTDPTKADTDGDGADDDVEVSKGTNPLDANDVPKSSTIMKLLPLLLEQ